VQYPLSLGLGGAGIHNTHIQHTEDKFSTKEKNFHAHKPEKRGIEEYPFCIWVLEIFGESGASDMDCVLAGTSSTRFDLSLEASSI
jgi:hypothetical protein